MLTAGSNASFAGNQKLLKGEQLSDYAIAVSMSITNSNLNCERTGQQNYYGISQYPLFAEKGSIDSQSGQPLLTFEKKHLAGAIYDYGMKMTVTSTPDFKEVQSLVIELVRPITVNIGDLRNPNITTELEVIGKVECK